MAQNYTRQSSFDDGDTITASLFNNEFNQIVNALAYSASSDSSTGHKHDGTSGQGGNIPQIGDIDFLNKIVVDGTNNRWGFFVQVGSASVEQIRVQDGAVVPVTDSDIDLGTSSLEFKDLFLDGTAHIDTLDVDANATVAGTLGVTGNTTVGGTLGVTGVLTGTSLDISGNVDIDGVTNLDVVDIDGAVDMASTLTVTGVLTGTSLDISGNVDVDGVTNLDVVDIDGAVNMATTLIVTGNVDFDGDLDVDGTTNLDAVDIDGAVNMATTALVTGVLTTTATQVATGGITSGSNIVSDTDSTDDLGTTSVRWANLFVDSITATDQITATGFTGTLDGILGSGAAAAATVTTLDTSGAVNLNLVTDSSSSTSGALIVDGGVGIAKKLYVGTDLDVDGTTNLDVVDIDGAVQADGTVTVGVDDTGYDVKFFGATTGKSLLWDESADSLIVTGTTTMTGNSTVSGTLGVTGVLTGTSLDISGDIDVDGTTNLDVVDIDGAVDMASTLTVASNIVVGGTVDGRDVATDGTKLDGIEASATADQTDAEIRTAVEAATDSNVFTDADHTKLNAIEASADVTDTANVTAAGALMDSELTAIASVKALNQGVATGDSPQFVGITSTANVIVGGNLTVNGTTTTLNTATLDVEDKNITVNYGAGDTTGSANGAGLTIQDAVDASTDATILWDTTNDEFDFSHPINVTGKVTGTGTSVFASLDISGDIDVDGTTNLDVVDIDGAVDIATTALVTGVLTTTATQVATGGITSGSDIISDTDSTDSLGSTTVRWLKGWFDTLTAGTLTIGSGSVTDSSGAISFGNENLSTTGTLASGTLDVTGTATIKDGNNSVFLDGRTDGGAVAGTGAANISVIDGIYGTNTIAGARIAFAHQGGAGQRGGLTFASKNTDDSSNQPTVQGVLTPAGNWGFGTTNPTSKVSVSGTLGVTGDTTVANKIQANQNEAGVNGIVSYCTNASFTGTALQLQTIKAAAANFNLLTAYTSNGGVLGFSVNGQGNVYAAGDITISKSAATDAATLFITNTGNSTGDKMDIDFTSGTDLRGRIRTEVVGSPFRGTMTFTTALGASETTQLTLGNSAGTATAQFAGALDVTGTFRQGTNPATAGNIRMAATSTIRNRNAANTGNIHMIGTNASDEVAIAASGHGTVFGGNITQTGSSLTINTASTASLLLDSGTNNSARAYFGNNGTYYATLAAHPSGDPSGTGHGIALCAGSGGGDVRFGGMNVGENVVLIGGQFKNTTLECKGEITVTGAASAAVAGEGKYAATAANGAQILGNGSTNDVVIGRRDGAIAFRIPANTSNVVITGSLSKGSGSFRIDHPLKPETHELVHSFTESPQADLLYSGVSDLVDGAAEINLDEFHGMTEGTFVALNRNIRVFTTNETDWEPIKGSVIGNILSISCQDGSCSDTVSWLVIGERHDEHMMDTDWTDEEGRVIVEPLKPETPAPVQRTFSVPVMLNGEEVEALETVKVPESIEVIDGVAVLTPATTKEILRPQFEEIGVVDVDGNPVYE